MSTLQFAPRTEVHPVTSPGEPPPRHSASPASPSTWPGTSIGCSWRATRRLAFSSTRGWRSSSSSATPGGISGPRPGSRSTTSSRWRGRGLLSALRTTIAKAKQERVPVRTKGVEVEAERGAASDTCDVVVVPLAVPPEAKEQLFVVLFEQIAGRPSASKLQRAARRSTAGAGRRRVPRLERELEATQQYLHSLIDDQERTNDDLNAANEELVSGNEELQSMNEELETAKEELQSTNEELTTVNDELHTRNQEVREINSDLMNILSTVDVPILILDRERRIRRFTPKARTILNVLPTDVGRPLEDIKSNLQLTTWTSRSPRSSRRTRCTSPRCRTERTLVPHADPALQDGRQQDRRRHAVAGRHRRAEAPRQRGRAGTGRGRASKPGEGRVPGDALARDPDAALLDVDAGAAARAGDP